MLIPISIHALLAESDKRIRHRREKPRHFYPRSPCGERPDQEARKRLEAIFLSTLSLRRATHNHWCSWSQSCHFYPRSPCGERPVLHQSRKQTQRNFYPRSPCGERLLRRSASYNYHSISIHALLAESDTHPIDVPVRIVEISIHALLAESDDITPAGKVRPWASFLSTLSLRRATVMPFLAVLQTYISIHALLAESDSKSAQNSGALLRI